MSNILHPGRNHQPQVPLNIQLPQIHINIEKVFGKSFWRNMFAGMILANNLTQEGDLSYEDVLKGALNTASDLADMVAAKEQQEEMIMQNELAKKEGLQDATTNQQLTEQKIN